MAQAFEFQKGDRRAHRDPFASGLGCEPPRGTSKAFFQIAAPGPIQDRIGTSNMGLPPDRRKRSALPWRNPPTGPIPGSAIRGKINRFWQI